MSVRVVQLRGKRLQVSAGGATAVVDGSPDAAADAFRSTDLLLGALGACSIGTMLTHADRAGYPVRGAEAELKPVLAGAAGRIARIRMTLRFDGELTDEQRAELVDVAGRCKVHDSLERGIEITLD